MNLALTAVIGIVAFVLSYGLFVPEDLKSFTLLAVVGAMAGYTVGGLVDRQTERASVRIWLVMGATLLAVASTLIYVVLIQSGSANVAMVVFLGVMLTTVFFSFAAVTALSGVRWKE